MSGRSRALGDGSGTPRRYSTPVRDRRSAETRERIVSAGSDLVHQFASWDWSALTFRAVAERAGVAQRTVYRHFPTERLLHDAVMARLEHEAGISYEHVDLANLAEVTSRIFATLRAFSARTATDEPGDPTFVAVDRRRREALMRAVAAAAPAWPEGSRVRVAAVLDVLWNLPAYERLVGRWGLGPGEATETLTWLIGRVVAEIAAGGSPPAWARPRPLTPPAAPNPRK